MRRAASARSAALSRRSARTSGCRHETDDHHEDDEPNRRRNSRLRPLNLAKGLEHDASKKNRKSFYNNNFISKNAITDLSLRRKVYGGRGP